MSTAVSENVNATQSPSQTPDGQSSNSHGRRGRRSRRGGSNRRGGGDGNQERLVQVDNGTLGGAQMASAATAVASSSTSSAQTPAIRGSSDGASSRRGRGGRGRGGNRANQHSTVVHGRTFGGSLTKPEESSEPSASPQLVDAPDFDPGPAPSRGQRNHQRRGRRSSKSSAPDIPTRIIQDIERKQYECPICTSEVLKKSKVWSCQKCWTVFHLTCIRRWSKNSDAETAEQQNGEPTQSRQWRCPGCNLHQEFEPSLYTCWCGKEIDPRSVPGVPAHSCGQTCGKFRRVPNACPHQCELQCHPGPCPPCARMGPMQKCFCGKETQTRRCTETDYDHGWSCGNICGDIMPCGDHECPRSCHEGLCGACEVEIDARCYCGNQEKKVTCCDKDDEKACARAIPNENNGNMVEIWTGLFQCTYLCERPFDCEKHRCQKPCHATEATMAHCPRSPDVVTHCPCGKTLLAEISPEPRRTCEDDIPNCEQTCLRELPCGHLCQQTCHLGDCKPCMQTKEVHCRCGRTKEMLMCHQYSQEAPVCNRTCHVTLNCGRHECGEKCCPGDKKASERNAYRKKPKPFELAAHLFNPMIEAEHICTRTCGRKLKCGNHICQELCHKGPCGSCREAIFHEVFCHCGRTVLQPPLACGTRIPPCRYPCERLKACGHPQVQHNCHSDDETCPKCPFLTEKLCMCGKKMLKNQQCWFTDVRCGEVCGKRLKCGSHFCRKTCHKAGECEDVAGPCQQACGKPKRVCGHPCEEYCHAPYPCKEESPCTHKIIITCPCQHLKQELRCGGSKTNPGNSAKALKCDDECARLERNRKLALALDIDPATHTDDHIPYDQETLNLFVELGKWAQEQEKEFRIFAGSEEQKRLRFKPMPAQQRAFLHHMADDFGLDSESMDPEPYRHVAVFKTPRFVAAPNKTLRDCIRIRQQTRLAGSTTLYGSDTGGARAKSSNTTEPANGYLLENPRFALTLDELYSVLGAHPHPQLSFTINFLPSDEVAFKASLSKASTASTDVNERPHALDAALKTFKPTLTDALLASDPTLGVQPTGSALRLVSLDSNLNVLHKLPDSAPANAPPSAATNAGGWSTVAAKAAAPPRKAPGPPTFAQGPGASSGGSGAFLVLENLQAKKRKEREEKERREREKLEVVEDWEAEEERQEKEEEPGPGPGPPQLDGASDHVSPVSQPANEATEQSTDDAIPAPAIENPEQATNDVTTASTEDQTADEQPPHEEGPPEGESAVEPPSDEQASQSGGWLSWISSYGGASSA